MGKRKQLSPEEREFFSLVARATFANPFGPERQALDQSIGGVPLATDRSEILARVRDSVSAHVDRLVQERRAGPALYAKEDGELLRTAFLFHVFHRHHAEFDELIRDQLERGSKPGPVPFARGTIAELIERGFHEDVAVNYFGLFYQVRRAYFLIYRNLVGRGPSMQELRLKLWQNVFTHDIRWYERHLWNRMEDFSTLLLGETGTGKGAAAAAIGRSGFIPFDPTKNRFVESFVDAFTSITLSQFSESLLESELFGHRKGAFTGAVDNHDGILARCSRHGAIFLDEIGDATIASQIRLLKVLEEREFTPVGSHEAIRFEGRIIAATNRDLQQLRSDGKFRDDFYYRLCSDTIRVPPLRRRIEEDPRELDDMVDHLVRRLAGADAPELTAVVKEALHRSPGPNYAWPGNVRELEQAIRQILLNRSYAGDRAAESRDVETGLMEGMRAGRMSAADVMSAYCSLLYRRHGSYVDVANITGLDRRTVKKYIQQSET